MKKKLIIAAIIVAFITGVAVVVMMISASREALRVLEEERNKLAPVVGQLKIKEIGSLDRAIREGWRIVATGREIRGMARFEDKIWAATSGGLLSISPDGSSKNLYTRLNGLPDVDVTCLAVHEDKLFAGSSSGDLVVVKKGRISHAIFSGVSPGPITALLSAPEGLYIGTDGNGVLLYDGKAVRKLGEKTEGASFKKITVLARHDDRLYIGTFDDGIYAQNATGFDHLDIGKIIAIEQVTSLTESGGEILVGTPLGVVAVSNDGKMRLSISAFVGAIASEGTDFIVGVEDGVIRLTGDKVVSRVSLGSRVSSLARMNGGLYAGTDNGIYKISNTIEKFYAPGDAEIPGNHITAILPTDNGAWIGTFENGAVSLDPGMSVRIRIEDEPGWAVNSIVRDGDKIFISHNAGVSALSGNVIERRIGKDDGLIGLRVSALCPIKDGMAFTTEAGVTIRTGASYSSLYSFHGLANNHAYACAVIGDDIYIGTLGGLSMIKNLKVARSWRPGDSPLTTGWITALAANGNDLFVGTYGGGVMKMAGDKWTDYSADTGKVEINPGAMIVADGTLLAGTLDAGLLIMDLANEKWKIVTDGLASLDVTAIAYFGGTLYIGTERGLTVVPGSSLFERR